MTVSLYDALGRMVASEAQTAAAGRTDIELSGYVWQTFDPELHEGLDRGFLLAGAAGLTVGEPQRVEIGAARTRSPSSYSLCPVCKTSPL